MQAETATIEQIMTEAAWRSHAARYLQNLGWPKTTANEHAGFLFEVYVTENGFTDEDFRNNPVGAAQDDVSFSTARVPRALEAAI